MGAVAEATRENFDELVESGTTLVDVWGPDCRPCLALMRDGEEVARLSESTISPAQLKDWLDTSLDEMTEEVS
jgi:thioredoxin-like negative regulator of GroEL